MKKLFFGRGMKILFLHIISLLPISSYAQSLERYVVSTAGSNLENNGYTLNFTFGEIMTQTFEHGYQISQGFQQVWLITTAIAETGSNDWGVNVYPNPTAGILQIETQQPLKIRIIDSTGRPVFENNILTGKESMNLDRLPPGIYNLVLQHENEKATRTMQVIKIQ